MLYVGTAVGGVPVACALHMYLLGVNGRYQRSFSVEVDSGHGPRFF